MSETAEVKNLQNTIKLINPQIIATLGAVTLEGLRAIAYYNFTLKLDAASVLEWNSRLLIPLYHPSPQVIASPYAPTACRFSSLEKSV